MLIDAEILEKQSLLFGFWKQGGDKFYFGHIPDEQLLGKVEVTYEDGSSAIQEYGVHRSVKGFELHIGNLNYVISILGEKNMVLIGPDDSVTKTIFEKLPNKITYSM